MMLMGRSRNGAERKAITKWRDEAMDAMARGVSRERLNRVVRTAVVATTGGAAASPSSSPGLWESLKDAGGGRVVPTKLLGWGKMERNKGTRRKGLGLILKIPCCCCWCC